MVHTQLLKFFVVQAALYARLAVSQQGPAAWTVSPFNPFDLPLAVRNPYLNTWLPQGSDPLSLGNSWANYWSNAVSARVPFHFSANKG